MKKIAALLAAVALSSTVMAAQSEKAAQNAAPSNEVVVETIEVRDASAPVNTDASAPADAGASATKAVR